MIPKLESEAITWQRDRASVLFAAPAATIAESYMRGFLSSAELAHRMDYERSVALIAARREWDAEQERKREEMLKQVEDEHCAGGIGA